MTKYSIEKIEQLLRDATPGPWKVKECKDKDCWCVSVEPDVIPPANVRRPEGTLIAAAPTIIRQLLDDNRKLQDVVDAARILSKRLNIEYRMLVPKDFRNLQETLKALDEKVINE